MNTNEQFKTSDLGLAATLFASGFEIDSIDKSNPSRVVFYFAANEELEGWVNDFWLKKPQVATIDLMQHIKLLKARIYS